jgi:hypothetical protein
MEDCNAGKAAIKPDQHAIHPKLRCTSYRVGMSETRYTTKANMLTTTTTIEHNIREKHQRPTSETNIRGLNIRDQHQRPISETNIRDQHQRPISETNIKGPNKSISLPDEIHEPYGEFTGAQCDDKGNGDEFLSEAVARGLLSSFGQDRDQHPTDEGESQQDQLQQARHQHLFRGEVAGVDDGVGRASGFEIHLWRTTRGKKRERERIRERENKRERIRERE